MYHDWDRSIWRCKEHSKKDMQEWDELNDYEAATGATLAYDLLRLFK